MDISLENALNTIESFIQEGWTITYDIVNQKENGTFDTTHQLYTYTSYVTKPEEKDYSEEFQCSFDTLKEMYLWIAEKLESGRYTLFTSYFDGIHYRVMQNGKITVNNIPLNKFITELKVDAKVKLNEFLDKNM